MRRTELNHLGTIAEQFCSLVTLLAALVLGGCNNQITYRIILPDNYVGWVKVEFEAKTPPTFDSHRAITLKIGNDGRCQVSSLLVYSTATSYEFLYETAAGLRPVRQDFVDHGVDAGGVTAPSDDPHYATAWYFFVGPKTYRDQHLTSEFTSRRSPLPTPGPLPGAKP